MKIILASKSPRRKEILENLGLDFEVFTADTDETCGESDPTLLVEELAKRKGEAALHALSRSSDLSDTLIISSDTVVACDGKILGKPHDKENSVNMLRLLSGKTHEVISGIALIYRGRIAVSHEVTKVRFDKMSDGDIEFYASTGEPFDKAGAYAVQGIASLWINGLDGDYFNVVGLPVKRMFDMLRDEFGILPSSMIKTVRN